MKQSISILTLVLLGLGLPIWLISCKSIQAGTEPKTVQEEQALPQDQAKPQDYAETRPQVQARDELTISYPKGEMELDFRKSFYANEAQLFTAIYEGLFSYHPLTMAPVPALASKWVTSDDKKQWTFTIRDNAKYQNGDPIKAGDFKAAWLSLLDPKKNAPYSSLFDVIEKARDYRLGNCGADEVGISAPDDKTLVVRLNSPAAFFPSMLCHHSFSPIHPSMLNDEKWTSGLPITNGPYYIAEKDEDHLLLQKNPNYWDAGRVTINKITIKFAENGEDATAMWNSGEARWILGDINVDALTDRSGIQVNAMFATQYYYIRSVRKPWDDYRLRQALTLVLPWDEIRRGYSLPAKTLVYPIPGYPQIDGLDKVDVDQAKKLLAEAGYPEGAGLPQLVIRITPGQEADRISTLMAKAWQENLGIPVKIDVVPFKSYYQALKQDDYDVGSTNWIGDFADPYTFLQMWCKDSNLNDAKYNDPDYEALIDKSMAEDGTQRWDTLSQAEELLLSRGNVLPISYSPALNIIDLGEIGGWYPNVLDIHPFKYMSLRQRRPLPGVVMGSPMDGSPGKAVAYNR